MYKIIFFLNQKKNEFIAMRENHPLLMFFVWYSATHKANLYLVNTSHHLIEGDFAGIGGLNLAAYTDELLLQAILGRGVQHLGLNLRGLGAPDNEDDLVPPSAVLLVLEVEDTITAVILGEILFEISPGGGVRSGLLQNDLSEIVRHLEQRVTHVVRELQLVELVHDIVRDSNTRAHGCGCV
jgi:hypothetical protein